MSKTLSLDRAVSRSISGAASPVAIVFLLPPRFACGICSGPLFCRGKPFQKHDHALGIGDGRIASARSARPSRKQSQSGPLGGHLWPRTVLMVRRMIREVSGPHSMTSEAASCSSGGSLSVSSESSRRGYPVCAASPSFFFTSLRQPRAGEDDSAVLRRSVEARGPAIRATGNRRRSGSAPGERARA